MWHALYREGIVIGREHTVRLMRLAGVSGKGKGRLPIITRKPKCPDLRLDLVGREFTASGPNKLWVGWCYLRAHFRRCRCKLSTRRPKCAEETTGLAHHRRSWLAICQRCLQRAGSEHGVAAFTAIVSDSYDNALAANVNVSYKNELIHTRRWNDAVEVEVATFEWVNWWNESRLHQSLGYRTSVEVEDTLWEQDESWKIIENRVNA